MWMKKLLSSLHLANNLKNYGNEKGIIYLHAPHCIGRMCYQTNPSCYFQERIQREPLREDVPASGFDV